MADAPQAKSKSKSVEVSEGGGKRSGMIKWVIGWLLIPGSIIGGLFGAGVHVGARHPDMLLTRGVLWMTKAEASRPPATPADAAPLSRQIYLLALPTKEFGLQVELGAEELSRLASDGAAADLDCEILCERVWVEQHPDKEFVAARSCSVEDEQTKLGALACELEVER